MSTQIAKSEALLSSEELKESPSSTLASRRGRRTAIQELSLQYGLVTVFIILVAVFWATAPAFGTLSNLWVILESMSIVAVAALGVAFSLAVGGWDLSIGSNIGFVVMVSAIVLIEFNWGGLLGILAGLLAGLFIGAVNALLIVKGRVPDMIATLGTMFAFEGLALVIAGGNNVAPGMTLSNGKTAPGKMGHLFNWIGNGKVAHIPGLVIILVVVSVAIFVVLERSRLGRALYAIGLNSEAARLAGIPVGRYRAIAYLFSGFLGGVAGIMLLGLLGNGQVNAGQPYLLECVAAALIAYAFFGMKRPSAHGTVFGALFVAVVVNGLTMFNVPYYVEDTTYGLLLIFALILTFTVGGGTTATNRKSILKQLHKLHRSV